MAQYDFNPRTSPLSGLSLTDLINSKRSALTTAAQSTPPILEALQRRAMLQKQQSAINAMSQGFAPGKEGVFQNPEAISNLVNSGGADFNTVMGWQGKSDELKRKGEVDKATIRYKNALAKQMEDASADGQIITWVKDNDGNMFPSYHKLPPGVTKKDAIVGPAPKDVDPLDKFIDRKLNQNPGQAPAPVPQATKPAQPVVEESSDVIPPGSVKFSYQLGGVTYSDWVPSKNFPAAKKEIEKGGGRNFKIRK